MKNWMRKITAAALLSLCLACGLALAGGSTAQAAGKTALEKKAETIVSKQVKKKDSKTMALKRLFKYMEKNYGYARAVGFTASRGWQKSYALTMIKNKAGSCYHFAAAYAYLAKEATGYPVKICVGTTNGFNAARWQPHAWVEIKISGKWYIFDPNMDKFAASSSLKYYKKERSKLYGKTYQVSKRYSVTY